MLEFLVPGPQQVTRLDQRMARPRAICLVRQVGVDLLWPEIARLAEDLLDIAGVDAAVGAEAVGLPLRMAIDAAGLRPEGYRLSIRDDAISLTGADRPGLFYGTQTLLQVLAFGGESVEQLDIVDWPALATRELMVDMGRAPFSLDLLKRVVRIMARLKLNSLHLHLYDDHLNGLRFDCLPLGSENPWAITIEQLRQLVAYARRYHVAIVPELEAWGHAGSILHHYPHLYGAPGMWGGYSFGIGEELYALLEQVFDEVVPVLDSPADVHLGLDEAIWATLPSVAEADKHRYSPESHVGRLYDILQCVGARHGKQLRLRIWADHGGRPVPAAIRDQVIVEPWQYFECREADIREKVARFGGEGKPPFMLGAGMSSLHLQGSYGATRTWCQAGAEHANCRGVDICLWESNDIAGQLLGIYGGADYAWSPQCPPLRDKDELGEHHRGQVYSRMKRWQGLFKDADDAQLRQDTGFSVYKGIYRDGPLAGRPVAATALLKHPQSEQAALM